MSDTEYRTIKKEATGEFNEKRSRFLCHVKPVKTSEEALAFIAGKKTKYWNATHNVYAYILREGNVMRYSDDGEPQGTAGVPALNVLQKEGIFDAVVVITRYFGGIMLGAGGLVRAYARGAKEALLAGEIVLMCLCMEYSLALDYTYYDKVRVILDRFNCAVSETSYEDKIVISFFIKKDVYEEFEKAVGEATGGSAVLTHTGERFAPV